MTLRPISLRWSNLMICTWLVKPNAIKPQVTPGLIPYCWRGNTYVSVVGMTVSDHRFAGVGLHPRNFMSRVNHICRFSVNQFCRFTSSAWPRCWAASVR